MELKGSKTEANLITAFSGECMARVKYEFYAAALRASGYNAYADDVAFTSDNEKEHAEIWWKILGSDDNALNALADAEEGELYEYETMYANFAEEAEKEGFVDIARLFRSVGEIEKEHAVRFGKMKNAVESGKVFVREDAVRWICLACGNVHTGKEPPEVCPVCGHAKSFRREECRSE